MLRSLLPIIALLLLIPAKAQKHVYDDLLIAYVDEDYEKCVSRADRYIGHKDTKNDPLPYLYMSKCYHEMSKREKYTSQPEYKNADREALKYAVRFRKKDKELEHFSAHEDYWRELNTHAMDAGMHWFEQGNYSKSRLIFSRMVGYDPENPGAWQMLALCQSKSRLERDAVASMKRSQEILDSLQEEDPRLGKLGEEQMKLMKNALILHSEHLTENDMQDSARVVLDMGIDHFADDPQFKMMYRELN